MDVSGTCKKMLDNVDSMRLEIQEHIAVMVTMLLKSRDEQCKGQVKKTSTSAALRSSLRSRISMTSSTLGSSRRPRWPSASEQIRHPSLESSFRFLLATKARDHHLRKRCLRLQGDRHRHLCEFARFCHLGLWQHGHSEVCHLLLRTRVADSNVRSVDLSRVIVLKWCLYVHAPMVL